MNATLLYVTVLAFCSDFGLGGASDALDSESAAGQIAVALPKASGAHGQDVEVPVTLAGAHELGCLQMALLYDDKLLEVVAVEQGPLLPKFAIVEHDKTIPGRLGLGFLSGPNPDKTELARIAGDGVIFNVRLNVLGHDGH